MTRKTRATTVHIEPLPVAEAGAAAPEVSEEERSAFKQERAGRRGGRAPAATRGEPPAPVPDAAPSPARAPAPAAGASMKTRQAPARKVPVLAPNAQASSVRSASLRSRAARPSDEPAPSSRGRGIVQRKDGEAVRHLSAYVPPGVFRELRDYAEGEGKSVSDVVCEAILRLLREVKR